ncbi:branched-chain amino acid ABC transporter permease [Candidatus Aerophobetes bacterium]|uniref:Branched-chain amino acid ABC transporter permease n=1 Tax=Aerophobetes bacterium TaxID=2030807 RepID=A0A662D8C4_UNCAE|nr:branched-chain amino acid ABC transporter permease [Candidatus Aerophobetes bacterium]RLE11128.1 MAG: branched-chain amino acid ABC transporter permease [Candidatus Aerophobetes bacterium]HDN84730.1 branched-chain amino acid ABC transporter permease [Candidatus Aerophobetes bacterium]
MSISSQLLQYIFTGIAIGSIYGMVALGFNIIYNATGIINLAQGEFVMLGGMIMISLTNVLKLPMVLGFFISVGIVTLIGAGFERGAIHPLKNPSVLTLIIITIAGSILFKGGAMFIWGKQTYSLPPFSSGSSVRIMGAYLSPQTLWILGIMVAVMAALVFFFNFTIIGKAMKACAVNKTAAALVGINVKLMVLFSFALSAAIGAVAGIIITPVALMDYDRGTMLAIKGFAAAVLGGLGSNIGAVIAGFIIGLIESVSAGFISSGYKDAIALLVLLLVLFLKPSGIMGSLEGKKFKK